VLALMLVLFNKDVRRRDFEGGSGLAWGVALGALGVDFLGVFLADFGGQGTTGREGWGVSV